MDIYKEGEAKFPVRALMPYLEQPKKGYRYSSDAVALGAFAGQKMAKSWLDLGTGCGVLAVRLAMTFPQSQGMAIDLSNDSVGYARKNLEGFSVSVIRGDLRVFPWRKQSFDLIVCNPPYFDANAFRPSRDPEIRIARHALHGNIVDFVKCMKPFLLPHGRFCFVFPADLVGAKVDEITQLGFFMRRQLICRSFADRRPHAVCIELGLRSTDPYFEELTLYEEPGFYTKRAWQFLKMKPSSD